MRFLLFSLILQLTNSTFALERVLQRFHTVVHISFVAVLDETQEKQLEKKYSIVLDIVEDRSEGILSGKDRNIVSFLADKAVHAKVNTGDDGLYFPTLNHKDPKIYSVYDGHSDYFSFNDALGTGRYHIPKKALGKITLEGKNLTITYPSPNNFGGFDYRRPRTLKYNSEVVSAIWASIGTVSAQNKKDCQAVHPFLVVKTADGGVHFQSLGAFDYTNFAYKVRSDGLVVTRSFYCPGEILDAY